MANGKTMQVNAFIHTDVRGKELMYLKISYNNNDVLINIGKKTFEAINDLATSNKQSTLIEEKPKGGK